MKERCQRFVKKGVVEVQDVKEFVPVAQKNSQGKIIGYTCQYQKCI
jgi:hypothetical protein